MAEPPPERSWWTTLPGLLTGLAALLTAMTGLLALLLPIFHARVAPVPTDPAGRGSVPAVAPGPTPPAPRDATPGGREAGRAGPEPRRAPPPESLVPAAGSQQGRAAPPLILGERLEIAGTSFEVLALDSAAIRGDAREIGVTFRVTAGATKVELSRSNVRILTPGTIHRPVEGLPRTTIPAGAARQLWVRFEIPEPLRDPYLTFTDDVLAPQGEVRRALPGR
jgi:hypothetical protein